MFRHTAPFFAVAAGVMAAVSLLNAQEVRATLGGRVTDAQRAQPRKLGCHWNTQELPPCRAYGASIGHRRVQRLQPSPLRRAEYGSGQRKFRPGSTFPAKPIPVGRAGWQTLFLSVFSKHRPAASHG